MAALSVTVMIMPTDAGSPLPDALTTGQGQTNHSADDRPE